MNRLRILLIFIAFSSLSCLCVIFLQNFNSPQNIEKRCMRKFEKDFENSFGKSLKEWDLILDMADNNYLKCMGIP